MTDSDVRRIEDKVDGLGLTLARLEGSLSPTLEKLTSKQDETDKRVDEIEARVTTRANDHEDRLRATEAATSRIKGALIVLAALLPIVAVIAAAFIH